MKQKSSSPKLCKAGIQLREQLDDSFPDRRRPDGWVADARHYRDNPRSDHIPDAEGWVRALDVSAHLGRDEQMHDLVNQLRIYAKRKPGGDRISYIIFDGKICSPLLGWRWRKYRGSNPHRVHAHISFTKRGDRDGRFFNVPMLGGDLA
jgi:hypothetical protein